MFPERRDTEREFQGASERAYGSTASLDDPADVAAAVEELAERVAVLEARALEHPGPPPDGLAGEVAAIRKLLENTIDVIGRGVGLQVKRD